MSELERERRLLEICDRALEVDPQQRDALLAEACEGDASLRAEVESLLRRVGSAGGFLESMSAAETRTRGRGSQLGRYTLVERIGEGGMGTVWVAERADRGITQTVAVKLIRSSMSTAELLARFENERRILAGLNHPYIAGLVDAGATAEGEPYLVMEYVQGTPIDRYCNERRLGLDARVRLIIKVAMAVQAAHQSLVIHRDLKPGNVLVTADGLPKLLDFGIAKLARLEETVATERGATTLYGHGAMTPNYASPEQILEGRVTTASDIYSLGVLAYELLVGELPYRLDARRPRELVRAMETLSVPRPSQQLTRRMSGQRRAEIAHDRSSSPRRLASHLAGDLDNILLMALRADPARRYGSAAQFADDLARYLDRKPVAARADSFAYQTTRFLQRHWLPSAAAAAVVVSLTAGVIGFAWQAEQARSERDKAVLVNEFLQSILIEADPYQAGADATIRDVLRAADALIAERFGALPDVEAPLRRTIGYTQLGLLDLQAAEANLARAHELNLALSGPRSEAALQTAADLAWTAFRRGEIEQARSDFEAVIEQFDAGLAARFRLGILNDYGVVLLDAGELAQAAELFHQLLEQERALGIGPGREATLSNNIASVYHDLDEPELAEHWYRRSIELGRSLPGADTNPDLAIHLNNLGTLLRGTDRDAEVLALFEEALAIRQTALGPDHGFTGLSHLQLGRQLLDMGRRDEARTHLERGLAISETVLPASSAQVRLAREQFARLTDAERTPQDLTP